MKSHAGEEKSAAATLCSSSASLLVVICFQFGSFISLCTAVLGDCDFHFTAFNHGKGSIVAVC